MEIIKFKFFEKQQKRRTVWVPLINQIYSFAFNLCVEVFLCFINANTAVNIK